jgi:hypothetical protein
VALRGAVVDPDERVLIDRNFENNHGAVAGSRRRPWRFLDAAFYLAQLVVQAVSP